MANRITTTIDFAPNTYAEEADFNAPTWGNNMSVKTMSKLDKEKSLPYLAVVGGKYDNNSVYGDTNGYNGIRGGLTNANGQTPTNLTLIVKSKTTALRATAMFDSITIFFDKSSEQYATEFEINGIKYYNDDTEATVKWETAVSEIDITFIKWNKPYYNAVVKYLSFELNTKVFDWNWLKSIQLTDQIKPFQPEPFFDVMQSTGNITLNDLDGELLDYARDDILVSNLPIEISVNGYIAHKAIVESWSNYNQNNKTVSANTININILNNKFNGMQFTENVTAWDILEIIRKSINITWNTNRIIIVGSGTRKKEISIKSYLESIIVKYAYLENSTYREAIKKICQLAQLVLIIDNDNNLIFDTARPRIMQAQRNNIIDIMPIMQIDDFTETIQPKNDYNGIAYDENTIIKKTGKIAEEINITFYQAKDINNTELVYVGGDTNINKYLFTQYMKDGNTRAKARIEFNILQDIKVNIKGTPTVISSHKLFTNKKWKQSETQELEFKNTYDITVVSWDSNKIILDYDLTIAYDSLDTNIKLLTDNISIVGEYFEVATETKIKNNNSYIYSTNELIQHDTAIFIKTSVYAGITNFSNSVRYSLNDFNFSDEIAILISSSNTNNIEFGNDTFVITNNATSYLLYSKNGANWYASNNIPSFGYRYATSITYGNNIFVGSGNRGTSYSEHGDNWAIGTNIESFGSSGITYGNNKFVACGIGKSAYSIDGKNFTITPYPNNEYTESIAFGNNKYVACGSNFTLVSTDAINWTKYPLIFNNIVGITFGNGKFIASNRNDGNFDIIASIDGINWSISNTYPHISYFIKYVTDSFFMGKATEDGKNIDLYNSINGIDWNKIASEVFFGDITMGNVIFPMPIANYLADCIIEDYSTKNGIRTAELTVTGSVDYKDKNGNKVIVWNGEGNKPTILQKGNIVVPYGTKKDKDGNYLPLSVYKDNSPRIWKITGIRMTFAENNRFILELQEVW